VSAARPLEPDGNPMRALRALVDTTAAEPATEYDVYRPAQWYITDAGRALLSS
jgi:hypothetical protein